MWCSSSAQATGPNLGGRAMRDAVVSLPLFRSPARSFWVRSGANCAVFQSKPSGCWKPGGVARKLLRTRFCLQEAGGRFLGWGQWVLVWCDFPLLPELWMSLRANPLSRSRAAGPRFNLWLYSFGRCDAVVVDAVCIANRALLCPAVLVKLTIRGFQIFSWADAA